MKFYLIVAKGKKQGMPIPVEIDLFLIGSGAMCQLRAVHDDIGEQHCAVVTRGRKVFVSDLDSGRPTFVNGEVLAPGLEWPLHSRDILEVGPAQVHGSVLKRPCRKRDLENEPPAPGPARRARKESTGRNRTNSIPSSTEAAAFAAAAILDGLNAQRGVTGPAAYPREGGSRQSASMTCISSRTPSWL